MAKLTFTSNPEPTMGVEIELALVDNGTLALTSAIQPILERLSRPASEHVKPELMQCYLEINTGICRRVDEAEADLRRSLKAVQQAADEVGVSLLWSATHPFSSWKDQQLTPNERYENLIRLLQDTGRQLITFGLHVHVGVDSGDKAVMICEQIEPYLPLLLALSANSPCWEGRITGLHSTRSKVMESLPTAGLPVQLRNWSEYTWLINHLVETGFINTIREIWWDVRPHHNFGTVEVRVCDMPASLDEAMALAALIQCLVRYLSECIDEGYYQSDAHPMMVRQNKWRAARYGRGARLVDPQTLRPRSVPELVAELLETLRPTADALGCREYLERVTCLATHPTGSERQLALLEQYGPEETVRRLAAGTRVE